MIKNIYSQNSGLQIQIMRKKKKNLKCFFNHFIFISFLLSFFPSWRLSLLPKLYFNTWLLITHDFCSPLTLNTSINILIGGNEALTAQRAWCSSEHEVYLWCCHAAQRRVHTTDMKWNLLFFSFYIQLSSHRSVCTKLVSQLKVHFVCRTCTSTALADIPKKKKIYPLKLALFSHATLEAGCLTRTDG